MMVITSACKGCGLCTRQCPLGAIRVADKRAIVSDACAECGICARCCPFHAVERPEQQKDGAVTCSSCPVQCKIPAGHTGACKRYRNEEGILVRTRPLVTEDTKAVIPEEKLRHPLITGVGAGTNYPCCRPAPYIVTAKRNGVDVVTVVTEAPLSYSGVTVKIDTNAYIGEAGEPVLRGGKRVGMVGVEEYGSKMLAIGGAELLTGKDGFLTARTVVELANGEPVSLAVGGRKLELQRGKAPVINGKAEAKMRVGCGSATIGLFAEAMKDVADEVIVLDHHVIGLLTEHLAGAEVGLRWSGVLVNANKSSRGRYFGEMGDGIGGTTIRAARDIIKGVDLSVGHPGMTIFVTDTTGSTRALFSVQEDGSVAEIEPNAAVTALADRIRFNCEDACVSVIYTGGAGGSARAGVGKKPLSLTRAIHNGRAVLTIGGAPAFVMPGGGINFLVDTGQMADRAFTWVPTPATVAPIEYTMTLQDYADIGGHLEQVRSADTVRKEQHA